MKTTKLLWIIVFNLLIIISEIVFGLISNSFALIADALHNTGDVIAVVITYIALKLGAKKTTFKYTFGYLKSGDDGRVRKHSIFVCNYALYDL